MDKKDRILGYVAFVSLAIVALAGVVATMTALGYGFGWIASCGFGLAAALLTFVTVDLAFSIYYRVKE